MRNPEEYTGLIVKMAKQFYPSFYKKKEFKDMIQEGYEVCLKVSKWEEKKPFTCPFHTVFGMELKWTWLNELQGEKAQKRGNRPQVLSLTVDDDMGKRLNHPALEYNLIDTLDKYLDLSSEMKMIVQILKDSPSELIELSKSFSLIEGILKYLKQVRGWKQPQLQKIKLQLNQLG